MTTVLRDQLSYLQRTRRPAGGLGDRVGGPASAKLQPRPNNHAGRANDRLCASLDTFVAANDEGETLVWERSLSEVWSQAAQVSRSLWAALDGTWAQGAPPTELAPMAEADPARIGWLDIESAGFMGRPVFLIGLMRPVAGELVITQLLARDYARERALLSHCAKLVEGLQVLVTFNGKCFDLPFLRDRMAYHRLGRRLEVQAVDLLYAARRRWRGTVPDCRLQTLERHKCRRMRAGDVPSALIPQHYHDFVRSQDASLIAPIMRHNRLDLLTMAELSALLLGER